MPATGQNQRWHQIFAWTAFAVALLVYPLLLFHYIKANSPTFDEGMHIAAGHRYWECADYGINPEHPPLLKLIAAAPFRGWQFDIYSAPCGAAITNNMQLIGTGYRLVNGPMADEILDKARTMAMLFPMLLLTVIFFATRAWFGPRAAGCAAILTVLEPNLTAHGPLVTTDMAVAATTFAAVFCADRYLHKPSLGRLLLLGITLGLALASKHTAVFVPLVLLLQFAAHYWFQHLTAPLRSVPRLFASWVAACVIALVVLWGTYQFCYWALPGHSHAFEITKSLDDSGQSGTFLAHALAAIARFHLLPESYVAGLQYVVQNSVRASYIFGTRHDTGVWYYFPVTVLVKTPLPILFLFALALVTAALWRKYKEQMVVALIPIAVFLLSAMSSKINLGVRHVLPVYPFLIVLAAAAMGHYAARYKFAVPVCAALLVFQAASYAHSYPNEMAYANEAWGGPRNLYKYLGDSNVDWGQALYRVQDYVAAHKVNDCWIAWFGARKPAGNVLPCRLLAGPGYVESIEPELEPTLPDRFSGPIFISNTLLDYDLYPYFYFMQRKPDAVIDGSILVYHGNFDLPEVAAARRVSRGWWYLNHQQPVLAVNEFAAAEPYMSTRGDGLSLYGWALEAAGQPDKARVKYAQAAEAYAGKPADVQWRNAALARVAALTNHHP